MWCFLVCHTVISSLKADFIIPLLQARTVKQVACSSSQPSMESGLESRHSVSRASLPKTRKYASVDVDNGYRKNGNLSCHQVSPKLRLKTNCSGWDIDCVPQEFIRRMFSTQFGETGRWWDLHEAKSTGKYWVTDTDPKRKWWTCGGAQSGLL